ncbi:efflux RND transporter periplasmic adaptor subunit [Chitinimonas viridis]|uniref:Efflux RND transporter periplasmic adaptor subunit n=1 Tax=Chitinimonas viridis TaxID=664880 RepID=A0ABT8B9Y6_9NEIS|nr:efflux RND transporter periplasmic adaptor subunit [Chitinimonas viridis]MDN3578854.1 efflux RND transporter periplasmic adaptor subunit [Chitinimonas viridis]
MHASRTIPSLPHAKRLAPVLILSGLLAACGQAPQQGGGGFPPPMVTYQTLVAGDVPVDFEYPGQTAGSREVEIRARVSGIVDKRLYTEGSQVKAGQPLFRIDPAPFAAAAAAADANVTTAEARLKQAERDYNRLKPLIEAKAVSQQEYDNAASALDIARASLKAAQAQARASNIDLGYTDVRAPITGAIGRALKVEGALANAQGDSLLATMAQTDPIHVNFAISEADHSRVAAELEAGSLKLPEGGYVVKLKTAGGQWLKQTGKLDFSDYKADNNTGAYSSRAELANPKNELSPGQFVRVLLSGATRPNAIAVPQRAVLDGPQGKFVYTVGAGKDGKPAAVPAPVVVGDWVRLDGKEPNGWVIKQGLKAGDKIIVDGMARIFFPFAPIVPQTAEEAAKAAAAQHAPAAKQ